MFVDGLSRLSERFVGMLKQQPVPHEELAPAIKTPLRENFPCIENHTPELSGALVRSDRYAKHLIAVLENPPIGVESDRLLSSVARGLDPSQLKQDENGQPTGEYQGFDSGDTLQDLLAGSPENERPLVIFNMVVQCLAEPIANDVGGDILQKRLNSLITLLLSTEINSFMSSGSGFGPRVEDRIDLGVMNSFLGAGKVIDRVISSAHAWTDAQILDDTPLHRAAKIIKQHDVVASPDSQLSTIITQSIHLAHQSLSQRGETARDFNQNLALAPL